MGEGNQVPDNVNEFLRVFEEANRKMRAVACFAEIMKYVTGEGFDDESLDSMDGLVEILMNYADQEVMHRMSQGS